MKKVVFVICFQLSAFSFQYLFGQWQQTSLDSLAIYCLDTSGVNIFAGTEGGGIFIN